jgi:hypothetical protein
MSNGRTHAAHLIVALLACVPLVGCAGRLVRTAPARTQPPSDALLILPGFGYGRDGERAISTVAASAARQGVSVYVPRYLSRRGLAAGRGRLRAFMREQHLERYERLHVLAFIAGAWTFNPLVQIDDQPNLTTVIYDRSPLQERAPRIAVDNLPLLAWARYGSPIFDIARTPYTALTPVHARVGLMVETRPTKFVRRHASAAERYGALDFDCNALSQPHDDCIYLPMSHDEVYLRFAELWPEVRTFIRTGRFSADADRTPPLVDPLSEFRRP